MNESSPIALVVLGLWVPVSLVAFMVMRPERALLFVVLGALLFLPELATFKFPFMPPLDKHNIPYICAFLGCAVRCPKRVLRWPKEKWFTWLVAAMLLGAIGTALTNTDPLVVGKVHLTFLPALTLKDGLYTGINQTVHAALPFFLGAALFRSSKDLRDLLAAFAVAGLLYVPFAAVEMRMSPQFHNWVYGYHQHSFLQTMRWGGYRPMVFMSHGLAVARFFVIAIMAAMLVAPRRRRLLFIPARIAAGVLFITLVLCKSTGAIVYGALAALVLIFGRMRLRHTLAVVLAGFVLIYPVVRAADLFPVTRLIAAAGEVNADRQQSLLFRFENEDALLARARERIVFGWGEYNRSATFDEEGRPDSVTDGHWIIMFGILGAVGFVSAFGMLLFPIFVARRRARVLPDKMDRLLVSGTSLMIGVVAVDLIPNGLWADYPYLLAGALMGATRALLLERARPLPEATALAERPIAAVATI
jgi:cell division protein FtsW (lipid II flippase)